MLKETLDRMTKMIEEQKENQPKQETSDTLYKCLKCKDTEFIQYKDDEGRTISRYCECFINNQNERRLARTPLINKKDEYTFEKYIAEEEWQKNILKKAKTYVKDPQGWFYIGGQVGAGKTHICTAITRNISYLQNMSFEYILFNQKMTELKQNKFENKEKYIDELNKLINTDILFIDDLLKVTPTNADLDILFDIINSRYLNNKICIISSEKDINQINNIDMAIGSRIYEKSKLYNINIGLDDEKNYRFK